MSEETFKLSDEELAGKLKRQLLELAIDTDNAQLKLDIYRATVERGKAKPVEVAPPTDAMTLMQQRVRKAANGPDD
jgi:hypothetical protein